MAIKTKIIRNLKTEWLEYGEKNKTIMLFLHGFPDDAHVWKNQIQYFKNKYHVIAPMMRGIGNSDAPKNDDKRFGLESQSLDLLEILNTADPTHKKKIVIVGHDLGTVHSWYLAQYLKKQLLGLVIINGGNLHQIWERRKILKQLVKSWYIYIMFLPYVPEMMFKSLKKPLFQLAYSMGGYPKIELENLPNANLSLKQYRECGKLFLKQMLKGSIKPEKIDAPVMSISGKKDAFLVPSFLKEISKYTTKPIARVIDGNHWLQLEQPERINRLIEKFIKGNRSK